MSDSPAITEVLVVDDDDAVRSFATRVLKRSGCVCSLASNVAEARDALGKHRFDLVLLDLKMPGESGMELLRHISAEHLHTAAVMMTSEDDPDVARTALGLGAYGYLVKPFEPNELVINVTNALCRRGLEIANRQHREKLEQAVLKRTAALEATVRKREQAEWELRVAHVETEQFLASISSVFIGVDEHGNVTRWNEAAARTFSIPAGEALGRPFASCGIRWQLSDVEGFVRQCQTVNEATRLDEVRFMDGEGGQRFLGIIINPVRGTAQRRAGFLLLGEDRTERKMLEDQLRQAQKLEAIGQLAAGIAHEINTPIQFIGDNATFLFDAFSDLTSVVHAYDPLLRAVREGSQADAAIRTVDEALRKADVHYLHQEIPKAIHELQEGVQRVARIVNAMKQFAHPGGEEKVAIDINKAIDNTITVARNEWKYVAEMVTQFQDDLPLVPCLVGEFNQVILNLIVNAAHAIADVIDRQAGQKGTITVSTFRVADEVEIRVRDTGTGIPQAIRSRVFEPFFTTKAVGKGTGQGLAITHAVIVKKHGGTVTFETEEGKGTCFIMRLPISAPPVKKQDAA